MNAELIMKIVLMSGTLLTEERRRHFEKELHELLENVDKAKALRNPHYTDAGLAKAEKALNTYLTAYAKELEENITQRRLQNA